MAGTWYLIASSEFTGNPIKTSCGIATKTFFNNSIIVNFEGYNNRYVRKKKLCYIFPYKHYAFNFICSGEPKIPFITAVITKDPNGDEIYDVISPSKTKHIYYIYITRHNSK